jgi:hypothetical protein
LAAIDRGGVVPRPRHGGSDLLRRQGIPNSGNDGQRARAKVDPRGVDAGQRGDDPLDAHGAVGAIHAADPEAERRGGRGERNRVPERLDARDHAIAVETSGIERDARVAGAKVHRCLTYPWRGAQTRRQGLRADRAIE